MGGEAAAVAYVCALLHRLGCDDACGEFDGVFVSVVSAPEGFADAHHIELGCGEVELATCGRVNDSAGAKTAKKGDKWGETAKLAFDLRNSVGVVGLVREMRIHSANDYI